MIKTGFKYKANFVKDLPNGNTMFSIGHKAKHGGMVYWTFFNDGKVDGIYDKCQVEIVAITGIDESEYKEKKQNVMYGKVKLDGSQVDNHLKDMAGNTVLTSPDDLPF